MKKGEDTMFNKIKYILKKNINMKTSYVVGLTIFSLFLVVGGISVALYTSQAESRGSLNIVTENLSSVIESNDLDENHSIKLNGQESKLITVTLKNINSIDAKFDFYYGIEEGIAISYDSRKDTPPLKDGYVIEKGKDKTYTIKITNTKEEEKTITFGSEVGLVSKDLAFPEGKAVIEKDTLLENKKLKYDVSLTKEGYGANADFLYIKFDINGNIYPDNKSDLQRLFSKQYYNKNINVKISWGEGENQYVKAILGNGELLFPIGSNINWLLNNHDKISIQIEGVDKKIGIKDIKLYELNTNR